MDWLEKEVNPPFSTWQYMLCAVVALFLIAGLVSLCIGSPEETETSIPSANSVSSVSVSISSSRKPDGQNSLTLPLDFHPWGAFEPGAWTTSRTIVEGRRLGRVSTKTFLETNVVLREKQNNIFTTVTESSVLLAGKSIQKEPQTKKTDFFGLPPEENRLITELPEETLTIAGVPIECRVLKITSTAAHYRRETRVWLNATTAPYIFRKERSVYRLPSNACCEHKVQNVTSTDLQLSLAGQVFTGYQYTQVSSYPTYISRSEVVASMAVPGRIVTQITRETDLRGRPLQVISTELLDFGSTDVEHQNRMFHGSTHLFSSVIPTESGNPLSEKQEATRRSGAPGMAEIPELESTAEVPSDSEKRCAETNWGTWPGVSSGMSSETLTNEPWRIRRDSRFTRFFPSGKRLISVEFSLEEAPAPSPQRSGTQVEPFETGNTPCGMAEAATESTSGPQNFVSEPLVEEGTPVNPEDFKTPFELTGLQTTYKTSETGGILPLMGSNLMGPGFFPQFQARWQIGKELLLPGILPQFTRFFPHLSGEKWGEFLRERNGLKPQPPKSRSPLYDENLRSQEPVEMEEEEVPDFVFPEDSSVQTSENSEENVSS